jgi:hypothetical protein
MKEYFYVSAIENTSEKRLSFGLEFHVRETLRGVETSQVPKIQFDGLENFNHVLIAKPKLPSHSASLADTNESSNHHCNEIVAGSAVHIFSVTLRKSTSQVAVLTRF